MTRPSSLCKHVSFRVPTSWGELTQHQLEHVLLTLYTWNGRMIEDIQAALVPYFCHFTVMERKDAGWLCLTEDGKSFLLDPELLPSMAEQLAWLAHPEECTIRVETVGHYKAVDFMLRELEFGRYLQLENYYQFYLQTKDSVYLDHMAAILYRQEDDDEQALPPHILLGVFTWYTGVKHYFSTVFTHFLKPTAQGQEVGTQQSQRDMVTAQIRLLTKGDITKNEAIINTGTWDALTELDWLARESEEFKQKYGKNNV